MKQLSWKKKILDKWVKEKNLTKWVVDLARKSKNKRFEELRKKGLV